MPSPPPRPPPLPLPFLNFSPSLRAFCCPTTPCMYAWTSKHNQIARVGTTLQTRRPQPRNTYKVRIDLLNSTLPLQVGGRSMDVAICVPDKYSSTADHEKKADMYASGVGGKCACEGVCASNTSTLLVFDTPTPPPPKNSNLATTVDVCAPGLHTHTHTHGLRSKFFKETFSFKAWTALGLPP